MSLHNVSTNELIPGGSRDDSDESWSSDNTPAPITPTQLENEPDDDFQDASEQVVMYMDLHLALEDCTIAINKFFNNDLKGAIAVMTPWQEHSMYHALGAAIFEFIPGVLTMDPEQIRRAQAAVRHTLMLCNHLRRTFTIVQSIGSFMKKGNYASYTETQAHAELVYAEALLLLACIRALEGEDMAGLIKASVRIKKSYSSYKICYKILRRRTWESSQSKCHFESGVRLGLASFNVLIAMLPPKVITVLEFVGFTADRRKGIVDLTKAATSPGLRSVLCELALLAYYLVIGHFASIPPNLPLAEKILRNALDKYPNSVWFLMFRGRLEMLRGSIRQSLVTYDLAVVTCNLWPQIQHLAFWEMMWANCMLTEWRQAAKFAALLESESKWSRTIYAYTNAAILLQLGVYATTEERSLVRDLLQNAPRYRQRLLGKSLPMEKFVVMRCERWNKRGYLLLPGIELLALWNMFPVLAGDESLADRMLKIIEQKDEEMHSNNRGGRLLPEYDTDDCVLIKYLHGSLLSAMNLPRLALQHLQMALSAKDGVKDNTFLLPYATVEMGMCYYALGNTDQAIALLMDARKKYSGYSLESRLHFRIHSKLSHIRTQIENAQDRAGSSTSSNIGLDFDSELWNVS